MILTTMWTHGNSLVVEDPGEYENIRHRGWGTVLTFARRRDDEQNLDQLSPRYCHIPLPTPSLIDGAIPWLTKVYILYETQGFAKVGGVGVWDANNLVESFGGNAGDILGFGNNLTLSPLNASNNQFTLTERHQVAAGIGITLACYVDIIPYRPPNESPLPQSNESDPWILTVAAVGVDYAYPTSTLSNYKERSVVEGVAPVKLGGK